MEISQEIFCSDPFSIWMQDLCEFASDRNNRERIPSQLLPRAMELILPEKEDVINIVVSMPSSMASSRSLFRELDTF